MALFRVTWPTVAVVGDQRCWAMVVELKCVVMLGV